MIIILPVAIANLLLLTVLRMVEFFGPFQINIPILYTTHLTNLVPVINIALSKCVFGSIYFILGVFYIPPDIGPDDLECIFLALEAVIN